MKYILIALLLSGTAQAQETPSKNDQGLGYFDSTAKITVWKSGRIEIKGDTIAAIKMLYNKLQEGRKREMELTASLVRLQKSIVELYDDWLKSNEGIKRELEKMRTKN